MLKAKKYISTALLLLLTVLVIVFPLVSGVGTAHALTIEAEGYTDVLFDLKKDEAFNENLYPLKRNDYSLQVLGIAESSDKELFVYVYQPSGDARNLSATSINISKGYKTLKFVNYKLTLLNSNKTFYKYKVDDFVVEDASVRYYDITGIYRAWNEDYDDELDNGNTISEVVFNVSRLYRFENKDGKIVVDDKKTDTIKILSKYVGFVRYYDGFKFSRTACDSHYVAFSTDMPIDTLQSADVYYTSQSFYCYEHGNQHLETYGAKMEHYATVTSEQTVRYDTDGLWNVGTINRDRIVKVDDFLANENINCMFSYGIFGVATGSLMSQTAINELKEHKWVIRFAETPYSNGYVTAVSPMKETYLEILGDVSILRLEGESDGKPFNLGVIDNKQTGSRKPDNNWFLEIAGGLKDFWGWLLVLVAVLAGIVVIVVICWVIRIIVKPIKAIDKTVKAVKKKNKR